MARVFRPEDAEKLGLPGRTALEYVGRSAGARAVTLRLVEIPVPRSGEELRGPHRHLTFEECIYVLAGEGETHADSGIHPLKAGDAILIPAGERHVTRNTGRVPLMLLCFFPINDIRPGTEDAAFPDPSR